MLRLFVIPIFVLCLTSLPALGLQVSDEKKLQEIEQKIDDSRERRAQLAEKADAANTEIRAIQEEVVRRAAGVRDSELRVRALEDRVGQLETSIRQREIGLSGRLQEVASTLAALQRLATRPDEVHFIRPGSAVDSARTGMLLAQIVPELERRAADLGREINELDKLKADDQQERTRLEDEITSLRNINDSLGDILARRQRAHAKLLSDVRQETVRLEQLAREAQDLHSLVDRLAAARREKSNTEFATISLRPFSEARGNLAPPVIGTLTASFGSDQSTGKLQGVRFATRAGAAVLAPYDGRVVYAGEFRTYGQLLIIAHSEGYHSLLAGMGRIDAMVGQWLLAGEPVGAMVSNSASNDSETSLGDGGKLYFEIRQNGEPVNPIPWLAIIERKAGG